MKACGIIVEYNPFHNGHIHHIEEARRLSGCDILIAVMSGNYTQRGDLSVIDKFEKTKAALEHGVDLVIELPYAVTLQNAYVFGYHAVSLLKKAGISSLCFGSETNNLEELKEFASLHVDVTRLKELLRDGTSYPAAYGLLAGALYPNDILAVTYLKALEGTDIEPISIQRTGDYHSEEMGVLASASAIRKAVREGRDISMATPLTIAHPVFLEDLWPYLRRLLITMDSRDLSKIFLMDEGIENLLKKNAESCTSFEDFMNYSISRRYTRSRIQRILCHLANQVTREEVRSLEEPDYLRILGFNERGRAWLRELKKKDDVPIITQFKNLPENARKCAWKSDLLYSTLTEDPEGYIRKELKGPLIV